MAILELKAARGWSQAETARRFLVKPTTVASWLKRIDESSQSPLVQIREPVNKFPEQVRYVVRRLKVLFPPNPYTGVSNRRGALSTGNARSCTRSRHVIITREPSGHAASSGTA